MHSAKTQIQNTLHSIKVIPSHVQVSLCNHSFALINSLGGLELTYHDITFVEILKDALN